MQRGNPEGDGKLILYSRISNRESRSRKGESMGIKGDIGTCMIGYIPSSTLTGWMSDKWDILVMTYYMMHHISPSYSWIMS